MLAGVLKVQNQGLAKTGISKGLDMTKRSLNRALPGAFLMLLLLLAAAGCAQTPAGPRGQVIQLGAVEYAAAFEAGLAAMREQFAIEKQDEQGGEIIGRPTVYSSDEPSGRISTGLTGAKVQLRRKAWLRLSRGPEAVAAEVRVDIERRDTQDYQMYEGILAAEDLRMRTPAERRDTAGPDRREVWTFIRRDLQTEEILIRGLRERLERR